MKTMRKELIGLAALLLTAAGGVDAAAKNPRTELPAADIGARLGRVDREIERRRAELSYFVWNRYLEYAERAGLTIEVFDFPGVNGRALCDTVPEIAALHRDFLAADSAYVEVLRTDPAYEKLHAEYVRVRDLKLDDARRRPNYEGYQELYARLRRDNPDYQPVYKAFTEAKRVRNQAIARRIGEYFQSVGRPIPYQKQLSGFSKPMQALREEWPEIGRMDQEISVLRKLRGELYERQQREALEVPREADPESKSEADFF